MSDLGNIEIFAKNLKYYMDLNGKNRNDVCRDLNLPYTTFAEWYNGNIYPRIDKIELLARYFQIEKSDLIEDKSMQKYLAKSTAAVIPVLGTIPAGIPLEAIEDIIDYEEIPADMCKGDKEYFGLKIQGNSMYPQYLDGDIIIVLKQNDCESGDDCVVMVNGNDATFKRVTKTESGIILQPLNTDYQPIVYNNIDIDNLPVNIIGVAVEIRRSLRK